MKYINNKFIALILFAVSGLTLPHQVYANSKCEAALEAATFDKPFAAPDKQFADENRPLIEKLEQLSAK